MTITVNLGTGANLLSDFLWDILDNDSRYVVAHFTWDLNANLFWDFLLHIHRVLCAHCFGEFFAFFPWNRVATKIFDAFGEALFKEFIIGLKPVSTDHYIRPGTCINHPLH